MAISQPIRARLVIEAARLPQVADARSSTRRPSMATMLTMMMLSLVALSLSACVSGDVPAAPADDPVLVEGRALYSANCVNCHGTDGGGGVGSKLNGGRLVERYPDPAEQLLIVTEGRRAMPSFAEKLSADELEAVLRYTREIIAEQ